MKFRLVEAPERQWPPSMSTIDAYNNLGSQNEQINFLKNNILPHPTFKKLFGIRPIIVKDILKYGLDPKRNPFLNFISNLTIEMPDAATYKQKMQYIYDAYENKQIDLKMPVLNNASLYSRNYKDFQYTLNAFKIFSDPKKVALYFKDTSKADISQFMDGNNIKPAGIDGREGDTIYNAIEAWASNGNEYTEEEIADNKNRSDSQSSIASVIRNTKHHNYKYLANIVDLYYPEADISTDSDSLYLMLYTAFTLPNIENICNNTQAQMLVDVKQGLQNEITPSELKPQENVAPGTLIHTPNVKGDPVSLYFFHNIITLTKNDKFIANNVENEANYLQDIILDAPMRKVDIKDKAEFGKEFVRALANAYETTEAANILNDIWQEKIV